MNYLNNFTDGKSKIVFEEIDIINEEITNNNFFIKNNLNSEFNTKDTQYFVENLKNGKLQKIKKEDADNLINKKIESKINKIEKFDIDKSNQNFKLNILKILYIITGFLPGITILNTFILLINFGSYSDFVLRIFHLIYFGLISSLIYSFNFYIFSLDQLKNSITRDENEKTILSKINKKIRFQFISYSFAFLIIIIQKFFIWRISSNPQNSNNDSLSNIILQVSSVIQMIFVIVGWFLDSKEEIQKLNIIEIKNN